MVESSIASVAAANYPSGRLEIIAIDDGSKDDTWRYNRARRAALPRPGHADPAPGDRGKRGAPRRGLCGARAARSSSRWTPTA